MTLVYWLIIIRIADRCDRYIFKEIRLIWLAINYPAQPYRLVNTIYRGPALGSGGVVIIIRLPAGENIYGPID